MEDICNYFITGITDTPLQNHKRQWHSSLAVLAVSAEHKLLQSSRLCKDEKLNY